MPVFLAVVVELGAIPPLILFSGTFVYHYRFQFVRSGTRLPLPFAVAVKTIINTFIKKNVVSVCFSFPEPPLQKIK